jgi:hypothetical protein
MTSPARLFVLIIDTVSAHCTPPLQAAPVLETFAKGRSAGARIFRVIERVPEIDPEVRPAGRVPVIIGD